MKRLLAILFLIVMVIGCATTPRPQLSREQWLAVYSRHYTGVTKEQVISAAERLFQLADGNDFTIIHTEDGVYATRNWSIYLILAAAMGTDYWQLKVTPDGDGVKATVQVNSQSQAITPVPTSSGAWTATTGPMAGTPVGGTAIYDVFWSRMDYLLGKRPDWMNCEMADERVKQGVVWGPNDALCNSFNVEDETPSVPILTRKAD